MHARSQRVVRTLEGVHCAILALSTFLAGLYFGRAIPAGVDLLLLQAGLVGVIAFLGLTHVSAVRRLRRVENTEACQVEERLSRHTSPNLPHLILHSNRSERPVCHIPTKSARDASKRAQSTCE